MTRITAMARATAGRISRFAAARRGNVATMFAILLIPLIGLVGAAVDYSTAYRAKERIQNALDATSLAVNRAIGTMSEADLRALAQTTFAANMGGTREAELSRVDISTGEHTVSLEAKGRSTTMFLAVLGVDKFDLGASSTTISGQQTFEIALVLDNSGSMQGSKIRDLRDAARLLVDVLFAGQSVSDVISVAVVPFAGAVNVGPEYRTASWIDAAGRAPANGENFETNISRFTLYDRFSNASWAGCVETRPYPADVEDTQPSAANPQTLFVPMFAPDEPDDENSKGYRTLNDYLDDAAGGGNKGKGKKQTVTWDEAQGNLDKYPAGVKVLARGEGPNMLCDSAPITPLTNRRSTIDSAIGSMKANGMTNIHEGVMWGWRTLSPSLPFDQALAYNEVNNNKVIVMMTDGENTHRGVNSPNMSMYTAYGFARNGRLGSPTSSTSTLVARMNERTAEACTNAKQAGVTIYTIAFEVDDATTRNLLRGCASSADKAFVAGNGGQLIAAFENIAKQLSALRISK